MKKLFGLILMFSSSIVMGQYAPAAGIWGTTAIHQDSNIFMGWANGAEISRGWINIADTTLGKASVGTTSSALFKADNDVISLGDGGMAKLSFASPIFNGPGWDFAVFENSFDGNFLELAFVEVSSDGQHFFRFPAHSLTQDSAQITAFGIIDPTKIHNLAGKYKVGFGTPFDLEELKNISALDVNHITNIRIIDVVGSIDTIYATYDTAGNIINDPWPMSFTSSGFDLDAVGVIHSTVGISKAPDNNSLQLFPNPAHDQLYMQTSPTNKLVSIKITNLSNRCVFSENFFTQRASIDVSDLPKGVYIITATTAEGCSFKRKIVILPR